MRKRIAVILFILSIPVLVYGQDFKTLKDGIEYAEMTRGTAAEPVKINLLRLDLKKVRLDVVHAMDAAIGLEKTSSIATRHGAFAAINAGFFKMDGLYKGDAAGVLMIDDVLYSESYNNRTALYIINSDHGRSTTDISIERVDISNILIVRGKKIPVGTNRARSDNDLVVYTNRLHLTTLTGPGGVELIVRKNRVDSIVDGYGSSVIPSDGYVISASGQRRGEMLALFKKGDTVKLGLEPSGFDEFFNGGNLRYQVVDIVGGVPQLIKDGKIDITWEQEKINKDFVTTRHPRTAVAKLKDGKFLMVTVDGRQPGHSIGIDLNDLATLLLELGAVDAMNLDGGGSTTMFVDGKVMNKPSDKEGERQVSDAILVFPRTK